jgi:hypothetical protein
VKRELIEVGEVGEDEGARISESDGNSKGDGLKEDIS